MADGGDRTPMTDRERALAMRAMRDSGATTVEIGETFGMTHQGVSHALRREVPVERPPEAPRRPRVRARTESMRRFSKRELDAGRMAAPEAELAPYYEMRPKKRSDCLNGENAARPCPWLSCRFNTYLDVNEETGSVKFNFPDTPVEELPFSNCALDHADAGGITLEAVGMLGNTTRERARQVIERALHRIIEGTPPRVHLRLLDTLDAIVDLDPDRASTEAPTSTALDTLPRVVRALPSPPPAQERPTLDAEGRAIAARGMLATNPRRIVARGR